MASTPAKSLIVCPHCCHAMNEQEHQLRCDTCRVAYTLPAWQGADERSGHALGVLV